MTDQDALTLTIWGEARGEPIEGMIGVAMVVRNRVLTKYRGATTYAQVCLAPEQFSCWTQEKSQMSDAETNLANWSNPVLDLCEQISTAVIADKLADNTNGATHYYADKHSDAIVGRGAPNHHPRSSGVPERGMSIAPLQPNLFNPSQTWPQARDSVMPVLAQNLYVQCGVRHQSGAGDVGEPPGSSRHAGVPNGEQYRVAAHGPQRSRPRPDRRERLQLSHSGDTTRVCDDATDLPKHRE